MTIYKAPFEGRDNFGEFLNTRGLTNYGVEIGTHLGEFAEILLLTWDTKGLTCVDPWQDLPEYQGKDEFLWGEGTREDHYHQARLRLSQYGNRATLLRRTSLQASRMFPDESFDFVYVDGNHKSAHVYQDLHLWWKKLGPGGILAGHDFILPGERDDHWEKDTQTAVSAFADYFHLDTHLVIEQGTAPWSYYFIKETT